jgi:hypothetical protein
MLTTTKSVPQTAIEFKSNAKKNPCHGSSKSGGHNAHPTRSGFVTSDATDFDNGTLMSAQKARGIGDC